MDVGVIVSSDSRDEPVAREVWRRLAFGRDLDGLGLGKVDGRWDLRRVPIPSTPAVLELKGVVWRGINFSGATFVGLRFTNVRVEDCVFDRCSFDDWRLWRSVVSDCSFRRADLRGTGMAGGHSRKGKNIEYANV